jgi:hypothetical protein
VKDQYKNLKNLNIEYVYKTSMEASIRYMLLLFILALLAAVAVNLYNFSFAQSLQSQSQSGISSNCASGDKLMDYHTAQCLNTLFKTNGTLSHFDCGSKNGWDVTCAGQIDLANHSDVIWASSFNGGQSYGKEQTISSIMQNSTNARNPMVAVSIDKAYIAFESEMSPGKHDVFFLKSDDAGMTFGDPVNLSNTPSEDTTLSFLNVDDTGKVLLGFINQNGVSVVDPSGGVYCSRC